MTQNTFLAFVILNATAPLYRTTRRSSGRGGSRSSTISVLAAGIMWIAATSIFLTAIMAVVVGWMRAEAGTGPCRSPGRCRAGRDPDPRATARRAAGRRTRRGAGSVAGTGARLWPASPRAGRRHEVVAILLRVDVPAADHGHDRPSRRSSWLRAAWNVMAATPSAPDGSTTSRLRSAASRTAAAISASETVTIDRDRARRCANVRRRGPASSPRRRSSATRARRPADDLATLQRFAGVGRELGLDADDARRGPEGLDRGGEPAREPAATDRDEDGREVRQVLDELEPDRPWPAMIRSSSKGGMIVETALGGELRRPLALVAGRADDHDLGAVGRDPVALDRRGVRGHHDDGRRPEQASR